VALFILLALLSVFEPVFVLLTVGHGGPFEGCGLLFYHLVGDAFGTPQVACGTTQFGIALAKAQGVTLLAQEDVASRIVAELAKDVLGLKERIEGIDEEMGSVFSPILMPKALLLIGPEPHMSRARWWCYSSSSSLAATVFEMRSRTASRRASRCLV
jgi:hypothetical protein